MAAVAPINLDSDGEEDSLGSPKLSSPCKSLSGSKNDVWSDVFLGNKLSRVAQVTRQTVKRKKGLTPADIRSTADEIEKAEQRMLLKNKKDVKAPKRSWYSIHPHMKNRQRWDIVNILLICYSAMAVPFNVCFDYEIPFGLIVWDYIVDVFFGVDIAVNFCTGVERQDKSIGYGFLETSMAYIRSWFFMDIISAFPWELCLGSDGDSANLPQVAQILKVLKLSKLLKLLRLFRIMRILRIVNRLEYALDIQEGFRHLSFFFFSFLLLTHWFSCLFYFLGDTNRDADGFWAISTANDLDSHITYLNYIAAICWTIMTLTTVGYGDISSNGTPQRILSVLAMITGALFFAYGVSNIVSIVDEFRAESKVFKKRMEKFNLYMHTRNLPDELKGDIREFLHNIRKRQKESIQDEEVLLSQLSMGLRSRVAVAINEQHLKEMPFFIGTDADLTLNLALVMESIFYSSEEDVVKQGDEGETMYFIVAGKCAVLVLSANEPEPKRVAILTEKEFFGEQAILMPKGSRTRLATVRTISFSEFRLLDSEAFVKILSDFPEKKKSFELSFRERTSLRSPKGNPKLKPTLSVFSVPENEARLSFEYSYDGSALVHTENQGVVAGLDSPITTGQTLMGSLSPSNTDFSMTQALDEADDKTEKIKSHVSIIMQAHQGTCKQLEELLVLIDEVRSSQQTLRSSSVSSSRCQSITDDTVILSPAASPRTSPRASPRASPTPPTRLPRMSAIRNFKKIEEQK